MKNYGGKDLSPEYKSYFRKEKKNITNQLTAMGCTNIEMHYGFYFFSGFFTAPSGQVYYFSEGDKRFFDDGKLLYRTAKHYKDFAGGHNQFINKKNLLGLNNLHNMKLI